MRDGDGMSARNETALAPAGSQPVHGKVSNVVHSHGAILFRVARTAWLLLAVAGTVLFAIGPITAWSRLQTVCHPATSCAGGYQLDAATARILASHGISPLAYAVFIITVLAAVWILWYGLAALIIWRRPTDRGALLAAFFLVLFPQLAVSQLVTWSPGATVALVALITFGLLFPDGRFAPRWTRWLAVFGLLVFIFGLLPFASNSGLWIIPALLLPATIVGIQIYRFRRVSSWAERQQTKWALLGLAVGILSLIIFILPGVFAVNDVQNGGFYAAFIAVGFAVAPSSIPIAMAIAVLHSRLWDIDRVISRALVYAVLSVTVAGIYIGGVIGLQALFGLFFLGGGSPAAIAVSTLAIVALFGPMRRRIQNSVDRRFYRGRYDAVRTLAGFSERLRDQVDLAYLSRDLTLLVRDTLQPEHVSLWLRQGDRRVALERDASISAELVPQQ
jgi:hypothetical protein